MGKKIIKVLVANDHSIIRDGLKILFEKHSPNIEIVGEAANFEEILGIISNKHIDILITDDIMPGGDLLNFLPLIKERYPGLKIMVQSIFDASALHINKAIGLVEGLIGSLETELDYITAIETVYCGGYYHNIKGYEKEL